MSPGGRSRGYPGSGSGGLQEVSQEIRGYLTCMKQLQALPFTTDQPRAALKWHPDRVPADSPERLPRTKKFQDINDAYFTLSDPSRRRDYDESRRYSSGASSSGEAGTSDGAAAGFDFKSGSFPWSAFGFGGTSTGANTPGTESQFNESQFGDAFEEMLREEGMAEQTPEARPTGKFWSLVGGLSGGAMGFIVANFPGAVAGAVAGNRLGAIRDAKGKSVYQVYQDLPADDKARLLSQLAARVFASAAGIS